MNKLTIEACPLCGGNHFRHFLDCTDHFATGERFSLLECEACGFRFTQDAPVEAEMGRYYDTPAYISHSNTHKGIVNTLYHHVRRYMLGRKARLVRKALHHPTGRILDIGAGTGYFIHTMFEKGWDVEAVEKSEQARQFALDHFHLLIKPDTELTDFKAKEFNVITLWHSMEHIEHLNELWETLYRLLDDKGVLVVAVPNCGSYDAEKYGSHWAAYDTPRHLWHFTVNSMQRFALKHNFILEGHYPMPFDAFYISMMSERYKKHRFAFVRGLFWGAMAWLNARTRRGRSSSVIYVFRKRL